ncbi:MAG: iron-containing alcohol dehydrogenase [Oscillospiraceae bacterium]|nr:iron-containing alcohol dehydrogenase [Oscillospiraceae bacterium]
MSYRPLFSMPAPVIFGRGAIAELGTQAKALGVKKALLIFEKGVEDAGIAQKAAESLRAAGVECATFNGVHPDPTDSVADLAGETALREGCDCLVGIGGGSSLDAAKAAAIYLHDPGPTARYILAQPIAVDTKTPVILIPTTSGTGSECTAVAIISRPQHNAKWSVFVNTTLAIVDPELTFSVPKSVTVNTALDAFAHAAEAMTGKSWNYHSDLFAEAAIRKIAKYLYTAWSEPDNAEARSELALAANWAGIAFNNPICHVGHSVADALSCEFHTPHGLGCALALPETLALVAPAVPERVKCIADAMALPQTGSETPAELGRMAADAIRAMMQSMEMPSLKSLGYSREQVLALYPDVVSNHLSSYCPVEITDDVAKQLLADVYDNYQ